MEALTFLVSKQVHPRLSGGEPSLGKKNKNHECPLTCKENLENNLGSEQTRQFGPVRQRYLKLN